MNTASTPTDKDALIAALLERIKALVAQDAGLKAENVRFTGRVAELEAKLSLPPRTADNSGSGAILVQLCMKAAWPGFSVHTGPNDDNREGEGAPNNCIILAVRHLIFVALT